VSPDPSLSESPSHPVLHSNDEIQNTLELPALPLVVSLLAAFCSGGYGPGCRLIYASNLFLPIYRLQTNSSVPKLGASCEMIVTAFQQCAEEDIAGAMEKVLKEEQERKKALASKQRMVCLCFLLSKLFPRPCFISWASKIRMEL
jgi:hypothetical protein